MKKKLATAVALTAAIGAASANALVLNSAPGLAAAAMNAEHAPGSSRHIDSCSNSSPTSVTCTAIFTYGAGTVDCYQAIKVSHTKTYGDRAKVHHAYCYTTLGR